MTTTAAAWRHVKEWGGMCSTLVPLDAMSVTPCDCTDPTPDPDSPCGQCHDEQHVGPDIDGHPHQPTRCICGHAIEEEKP